MIADRPSTKAKIGGSFLVERTPPSEIHTPEDFSSDVRDIYAAVESVPEVDEALVLGVELPGGGYWLPLFVRLAPGVDLDDALVARLKAAVREQASPRHVPDEVIAVPAVPHTATGKKLEVPLKRIAQGVPVERALTLGAVDDPAAVRWFAEQLPARAAARDRVTPA